MLKQQTFLIPYSINPLRLHPTPYLSISFFSEVSFISGVWMLYDSRKKGGLTATFHPQQGIFRSQISCLFLGLKTRAVFPHSCLSGSDSCWVEAQAVLLLNSAAGNSWANLFSLFWGARKGDGFGNTECINENLKGSGNKANTYHQ